ncbi:MAG: TrmB family transcriptional regulator [Ignavibacteriae bacterium]|nr:TrmB family transcriptional regulator [Ignavibacteriota bacterium]
MKDKIQKLENLGFTVNESKVFMSLMSGKVMTATEIADSANIPRTSVYEILKSFTEKGICNEIETPTKNKYEIIDPEVVKDKIEREIKRSNMVRLDSLENTFNEFKALYKADSEEESSHDIELLRGFNKHRHLRFLDLTKNSTKEILLVNRLSGWIFTELDETEKKLLKKGVVIKSIYEISTNFKIKINDKWENVSLKKFAEICEKYEKGGAEVRLIKHVPQNFAVFDKKVVFLNIVKQVKGKPESSDIITRNSGFAELMGYTFDNLWDTAMTVQEFKKSIK